MMVNAAFQQAWAHEQVPACAHPCGTVTLVIPGQFHMWALLNKFLNGSLPSHFPFLLCVSTKPFTAIFGISNSIPFSLSFYIN